MNWLSFSPTTRLSSVLQQVSEARQEATDGGTVDGHQVEEETYAYYLDGVQYLACDGPSKMDSGISRLDGHVSAPANGILQFLKEKLFPRHSRQQIFQINPRRWDDTSWLTCHQHRNSITKADGYTRSITATSFTSHAVTSSTPSMWIL